MSDLPRSWQLARLRDLGSWRGGSTPSKSRSDYWSGVIPWVSPKDMKIDVIHDSEDHITQTALDESSVVLLPVAAVLVVTRSGILEHTLPVAVTGKPVTINQDIKAAVASRWIDSNYLAYLLKANADSILAGCSKAGTTVASIDLERLLDFKVAVAPLAEQVRIVAKLDALFARSRAVKALLERLSILTDELRQSIWASALTGTLIEPSSYGFPWPKSRLSELIIPGRKLAYGVLKPGPQVSGGVRLIKSGQVRNGYMEISEEFRISAELDEQFKKTRLEGGEILLNLVGASIGRSAVAPVELRGANVSRAIAVLPVRPEVSEWVQFVLEGPEMQRLMDESKGGSAQPVLNLAEVKDLPITIPPDADLKRTLNAVRLAKRRLATLENLATSLSSRVATLDKAILNSAFCGELVPQDPNDEPASVLLERIRAERKASQPVKGTRGARAPASAKNRAPEANP